MKDKLDFIVSTKKFVFETKDSAEKSLRYAKQAFTLQAHLGVQTWGVGASQKEGLI